MSAFSNDKHIAIDRDCNNRFLQEYYALNLQMMQRDPIDIVRVDIVAADINMLAMDGFELQYHLQQRRRFSSNCSYSSHDP